MTEQRSKQSSVGHMTYRGCSTEQKCSSLCQINETCPRSSEESRSFSSVQSDSCSYNCGLKQHIYSAAHVRILSTCVFSAVFLSGMMLGGGCGRELAHWIIQGRPEKDMYGYDIRYHDATRHTSSRVTGVGTLTEAGTGNDCVS